MIQLQQKKKDVISTPFIARSKKGKAVEENEKEETRRTSEAHDAPVGTSSYRLPTPAPLSFQ